MRTAEQRAKWLVELIRGRQESWDWFAVQIADEIKEAERAALSLANLPALNLEKGMAILRPVPRRDGGADLETVVWNGVAWVQQDEWMSANPPA